MSDNCPICLGPIWDDDEEWCPYCGTPLDTEHHALPLVRCLRHEDGIAAYYRGPYDDEAQKGYAEVCRGEEATRSWPQEWKAHLGAADARRRERTGSACSTGLSPGVHDGP